MKIVIISSSVRKGRNSHRVSLYFEKYIQQHQLAEVEILDLEKYQFPIFEERLKFLNNPPKGALELSEKIKNADGVLIVTPEYNGGYPAALKNITDLLYEEWKRKPVAISTVSAGPFGGSQVITSLQFSMWKIGATTVPALFPVPNVEKSFNEAGVASDQAATDGRASKFLAELLWYMQSAAKMKN